MTIRKLQLFLIPSILISERLVQSLFFYTFNISPWFLVVASLTVAWDKKLIWPMFSAGVIFDLFSGLPFGLITSAVVVICLVSLVARSFVNILDSFLALLFSIVASSFIYCALLFWFGGIFFENFFRTLIFTVIGAVCFVFIFKYVLNLNNTRDDLR